MPRQPNVASGDRARIVALSVRQPYADHIIFGKKRIEVRRWGTTHRGRLFIHASSGYVKEDEDFLPTLKRGSRTRSAIIGMVTIKGIITHSAEVPKKYRDAEGIEEDDSDDATLGGALYWHLTDPVAFDEPIPCKGKLNLWTPAPEIASQLARLL